MRLTSALQTDTGPREENQDAAVTDPDLGLFAVADGMGGHAGGAVASRLALTAMVDFLRAHAADRDITWPAAGDPRLPPPARLIDAAVRVADQRVRDARRGPFARMGTTVAAVAATGDDLVVAHVGDSRVYRLRDGVLTRLTRDHTVLQDLIDAGVGADDLSGSPLGHLLSRAVGGDEPVVADVITERPVPGDRYLLCTDGLTGVVSEVELAALLGYAQPADAAAALVRAALLADTRDNVTALVVGFTAA